MNKTELYKKIGRLEFVHDQLSAELADADRLLRAIGFPQGLESAKIVAQELLKRQNDNNSKN